MTQEITIERFQALRNLAVTTANPLAVELSGFTYQAAQGYVCEKQRADCAEQRAQDLERAIQNALLLAKPAVKKGKKPSADDVRDALRFVREELEKVLKPQDELESLGSGL